MTNAEIGFRIHDRREELNLSLQEIAEKIGVAKSTISRYESGNIGKIKLPVIEAIAKALNVNPSWLLGKSDSLIDLSVEHQISQYCDMLRERKELRDLMAIAIKTSPAQVEKMILVFNAIIGEE